MPFLRRRRSAPAHAQRAGWTRRRTVLVALSALMVVVLAGVAALVVVERRLQGNVERTSVFADLDPSSRPSSEPTTALDLLVLGSDTRDGVGAEYQGTGDEVVEYKRFVYSLAETAAGAHREGGLLRRGEPVSEAEQAALDEIAAIFDEPPPAA